MKHIWTKLTHPIGQVAQVTEKVIRWSVATFLRLITLGEILGIVLLWGLFICCRQDLDRHKNSDPSPHYGGPGSSTRTTTYPALTCERTLPSGEKILINNTSARFLGDVDKDPVSNQLFPNFAAAIKAAREAKVDVLPSVSMIHHTLKREDDRLIESAQLAVQDSLLPLLRNIKSDLSTSTTTGAREACAYLTAALTLAGEKSVGNSSETQQRAAMLINAFESGATPQSDALEMNIAKVPKRYQRTPELARMFKSQRFLMDTMNEEAAGAILNVLRRKPELSARLEKIDRMNTAWNNPARTPHLRQALESTTVTLGAVCFLPWAESPDNQYYTQRYPDGAIPPDENWMNEIIAGIRSGRLDFKPKPDSGWYDYKFFALAPLVRLDQSYARRSGKLSAMPLYEAFLAETFKAALTDLRESHILSVATVVAKCIGGGDPDGTVNLAPEFSCEPEPSFYWRLAHAYQILQERVEKEAGEVKAAGVTQKIGELETLTRGMATLSLMELGLTSEGLAAEGWTGKVDGQFQTAAARAREWLKKLPDTPAQREDPRVMLNAAGSRKWGIAGVRLCRLRYEYESIPTIVEQTTRTQLRTVHKEIAHYYAPVLVAAEFSRSIPNGDFAAFCNRYQKVDACLAALGAPDGLNPEAKISIPTVLSVLSGLVLVHVFFWRRAITRWHRREGKRSRHQHRLTRAAWGLGLLLLIAYGPLYLLLFVIPRIDLPPRQRIFFCAMLTQIFEGQVRAAESIGHDMFCLPTRFVESITPRQLHCWALRSDVRSIRETALNSLPIGGDGRVDEFYFDPLYDLCRARGYGEASFAFEYLITSTGAGRFDEAREQMKQRFHKIREIYTMYDDPSMIFRSAYHIKEYGEAKDMELLEEKVRAAAKDPEANKNYMLTATIEFLLEQHPDILPYDRMVELGFFPTNPENYTSTSLTRRELTGSPILNGFTSYLDTMNDYPRPYETADPLKEAQYAKAKDDLRPADLLFIYAQRRALAGCGRLIDYSIYSPLSPRQWKRCLERATNWLIAIPDKQADQSFNAYTIDSLLGINGAYWISKDARDEAYEAALRRLLDSPWKERRNLNYHPQSTSPPNNQKTYGEIIKSILEEHAHPSANLLGQPGMEMPPGMVNSMGLVRDPYSTVTLNHDAGATTAPTATVQP